MKLQPRDYRWHEEITSLARRMGWTVWEQAREQQRPEDPRVLRCQGAHRDCGVVRSSSPRPSRVPPLDRFEAMGVRGFFWSPVDLAKARVVLVTVALPVPVAAGPDDAA
ncbi:hypothetical protein ACWELO_36010 [Streptomyces sp. NPDC004596]|uniref:hypothetical protein n=1 Tax=Streptomyces sp. DSM 118148 TaxID=3448667 RepID=UPI0040400D9F